MKAYNVYKGGCGNARTHLHSAFLLCGFLLLLLGLGSCSTSRRASTADAYLSSKVKLTVPNKDASLTLNGTMKLKSGERMQLSFLMPILRSEVARMEVTPDEILLVDRMGKRYVRATRAELKGLLPKKADFAHLEKLLYNASKANGTKALEGKDLGLPKLEKCRIELTDFSDKPFSMSATELSSKYKQVPLEELLVMLVGLLN
ncbi:MAG: DUF4292 domain-containing protein [Bacteroides sp.]|nr:DUF4292 domain-containing protein [Bacteroides sp.]